MYWDLLTKVKNAGAARKKTVRTSYSNLDVAVAQVLVKNGYLKDAKKKLVGKKKFIDLELLNPEQEGSVIQFKIISKPGRHVYRKVHEFRPVRQGFGHAVVSTSQGVMTIGEAKKRRLGGEVLFEIW
ncbi:MAG: 30S ribosomal protein S8 [Anaplasmataceae bacterium]|nr:30S ribosomal protein S8 [Anaplasmataceae bacterium]